MHSCSARRGRSSAGQLEEPGDRWGDPGYSCSEEDLGEACQGVYYSWVGVSDGRSCCIAAVEEAVADTHIAVAEDLDDSRSQAGEKAETDSRRHKRAAEVDSSRPADIAAAVRHSRRHYNLDIRTFSK